MPFGRLTTPLKGGGYTSKKVALTQSEFMMRYTKERNRLGAYEDSNLLPGELPDIKCIACGFCQPNDTAMLFCHAWHRQTDPDGFCYRAIPQLKKGDL